MPRSNRPRGRRSGTGDEGDEFDPTRVFAGRLTTERKRDGLWNVQPLTATNAAKHYLCPSCGRDIAPGTAHVVAWRADGLMGEADDLAARRHWHTHCWRITP
ncbi:hypothetical protein [Galbitalea soli]|uniref:ATP/GTP-binding protein n=1 Tax=Galbitalea soli TaxID=1268042 RepID=A0A7C9TRL3_9MICO|nr:hypothetical protein [Galbitalea soli]NEM91580.1 hypothetical protein [Galbitalea soli]NYJ30274.1 hypothetical protein [Galbitalea soli]